MSHDADDDPAGEGRRRPADVASVAAGLLLAATFLIRALRADQPIVENYVGRQVPTAMVARNLDRGSGFLRPQLDTAPLPNLFLVEPPLYAALAVGFHRATGLPLTDSGRLVSALAIALGGWGLFGLVRRREGDGVALLALAAFAAFPVTIRYGRAFQPDALMLGLALAGLRCWDEHEAAVGAANTGKSPIHPPPRPSPTRGEGVYEGSPRAHDALPPRGGGSGRGVGEYVDGHRNRSPGQGSILRRLWLPLGAGLLATALAVKVTAAYILVPLVVGIVRPPRAGKAALACALLLPALLWYAHAAQLLDEGAGSRASADNRAIWLRVVNPAALADLAAHPRTVGRLLVRSFTPVGLALAIVGLVCPRCRGSRIWRVWAASAVAMLALLAAKLHHEYYFLALAPVAAVGTGRALAAWARAGRAGRFASSAAGLAFVALAAIQSASTWRTPAEWAGLDAAAREVAAHVPPGEWVAAPEALLFAADRRGCRLEFGRRPAQRAAGEWGETLDESGPPALVEFYRARGARFVADVGDEAAGGDPDRLALHRAVRRRYKVLVDRPEILLAELTDAPPGAAPDADR